MTIKKEIASNADIFPLTKVMIFESFDEWTYTKGESYFHFNAVKSCKLIKTGITGKVKGNLAPYYSVNLQINNNRVSGTCSCPVGFNCKHCVALALHWLDNNVHSSTINKSGTLTNLSEIVGKKNNNHEDEKNEGGDRFIEDYVERDDITEGEWENDDDSEDIDEDYDDSEDIEEDYDDPEDIAEDNDDFEEEKESDEGYSKKQKRGKTKSLKDTIDIPANLNINPIQDITAYLKALPRTDLENLVHYFMPMLTHDLKITIFSPEFIMESWKQHLLNLDEDFKEYRHSNNSHQSLESDKNEVYNTNRYSPLKIFEQIKDNDVRQQCIQAWFKGYVDLINQIKKECRLRGMFESDGEDLYEYYKEEEYERMEEEFEEESNERSGQGYNRSYYDDYDELEPYEDFDLDTSTLKSYLENFFNWILIPLQELCEYISCLNQCNLKAHVDYLIKEGTQWLIDLELPIKMFGINPKNISALEDLKSIIVSKLSIITSNFLNDTDQVDFLFNNFTQNPSQRMSNLVYTQFQHGSHPEKNVLSFVQKLLNECEHDLKWEKFDLLKRLIYKHVPSSLSSFLEISITSLPKCPDAERIVKEIFIILEEQPIAVILALESLLLTSTQKILGNAHEGEKKVYLATIDWLVNYFFQQKMIDHAFTLLADFTKKHPKLFTFSHLQSMQKFKPLLAPQLISEIENLIQLILQKGNMDIKFHVHLELGHFNEACGLLKDFSWSSYSYLDNHDHDSQWGAIMKLLPNLSSITDDNKEGMIQILKSQVSQWVSRDGSYRPDASIAEAIEQIRTIYLAFETKDGVKLWQKWFREFSNSHWRLRNLRSALSRKGIELKKN